MAEKRKRYLLSEDDIPRKWYNIQADMPNKPLPPLNPGTRRPMEAKDLYPVFACECCDQEMNQTDRWIEIPGEVREKYKYYLWFVLMAWRRLSAPPPTSISKTRASAPWVHTSSIRQSRRRITAKRRGLPTLPPRPVLGSGVRHWPMQRVFSAWMPLCTR